MRNMTKPISFLLCLLLVLQLVGAAAGGAFADGAPDGACSVGWAVSIRDAEGNELSESDVGTTRRSRPPRLRTCVGTA